ncbi:MAG: DNA-processing protein DprA [Leeuwenhoekiella sp.]
MSDNELHAFLTLQHIPYLGDASIKRLLQHFESAEALLSAKKQELLKIDGIGEYKLREFYNKEHALAAEEELCFVQDNNIEYSGFRDAHYPERLKHCIDGPVILFQRGKINYKNQKIISIIGTRKVTTQGMAFTENFIEQIAPLNPIIVSGFAYGVDITAHKAAVKHGLQTLGVLAHGLNQIYPKVHKKYMPEVEENGGFLTDFWSTNSFDRTNFLRRNRIIAGISEATVVIESAAKGGSLVTAEIAGSYNRDVFAVPGRSTDLQSVGCNNLIKQQKAHLLTSAADLIYMLNWEVEQKSKPVQKQLFIELDDTERKVWSFLNEKGKEQLDFIALNCDLPTFKLAGILLNMELKGVVRPLPGKLFELI